MYFFQKNGKQHVDFRGDFVLSHNNALIKTRVKSSAPRFAHNGLYILEVGKHKLKATAAAIRFIWGNNTELTADTIEVDEI